MSDLRSTVRNRRFAVRAAVQSTIDVLEPRRLFSAGVEPTEVTFRGVSGRAVAGDYVISVGAKVDFAAQAEKAGFTNVKDLGGSGYYAFHTDKTPEQVEKWAKGRDGIAALAPDFIRTKALRPNDEFYSYQYLTNNTGQVIPNPSVPGAFEQQAGTAGADMNLEAAWNITTGSATQIAAVIDTGLDVTHEDIAPNVWVNTGEVAGNGLDDDGNGFVDDINGYDFADGDGNVEDTDGHGTAVAGVIAAAGNNVRNAGDSVGIGVAGVSWSTKLMAVKVFSSTVDAVGTTDSEVIAGLNYVVATKRAGANIVVANASLGGFDVRFNQAYVPVLRSMSNLGIVFVTAAGNDAVNNDIVLQSPSRPAFAVGNSLVVAATDNRDQLAVFSSFGPRTVDVAAPGVQVFTTTSKTAVTDALGNRINNLSGYPVVFDSAGNPYVSIDGTSFSSPAVAGVVALAKAAFPNATPEEIVTAIKQGVDRIPSLSPSTSPTALVSTGGRVDAYNTLRILGNRLESQNSTLGGDFRGNSVDQSKFIFGRRSAFVYGSTAFGTVEGLTSSTTPAPATVVQGKLKRNETAALVLDNGGGSRSASFLTSAEPINYTFDFGNNSRLLTFYVAGLGNSAKGSETISVIDTATGVTLASSEVSDYRDGKYVTFAVSGAVTVRVDPKSGPAVVNGIFVDNAPTGLPFVASKVEQGNGSFIGVRGDQGFVIPGGSGIQPTFASVGTNGSITLSRAPNNPLLLETLGSTKVRSGGAYTGDQFDINVNFTDTDPHTVTFYTAQTSKNARAQRISVIDSAGNVVASEDVTVAKTGAYVSFTVSNTTSSATSNTVTFSVTSLGGGPASVAGVFFSAAADPDVSFVGTDTTTGGQYRGKFGTQARTIFGFDTVPFTGAGSVSIVDANTKKKNGLQSPNSSSSNIAAYLQTQNSIDIDLQSAGVDLSSPKRVSLYFADYDKKGRVQRVDLVRKVKDPTTGVVTSEKVVSSQILRDFENGKYLTYDVSGGVTVRITRISGPTAVISGIFVD